MHRAGAQHQLADALSRLNIKDNETLLHSYDADPPDMFTQALQRPPCDDFRVNSVSEARSPAFVYPLEADIQPSTISKAVWRAQQESCPFVKAVAEYHQKGTEESLPTSCRRFLTAHQQEIIYHASLWCMKTRDHYVILVPVDLRKQIVLALHGSLPDGAHFGCEKVIRRLKQFFYWPAQVQDVIAIIRGCASCHRSRRAALVKVKLIIPKNRWCFRDRTSMDLTELPVTLQGSCKVLVVVEYATRFAWAIPFKADPTALEVLFYLTNFIFGVIGWPRELLSDNGGNMCAKVIKDACARHGCLKKESSIYNPQGNGKAENMVQQVIKMLRSLSNCHTQDWDTMLPAAMQCWNATPSALGPSPFKALLGVDVQPQVSAALNLTHVDDRHANSETDREAASIEELRRRRLATRSHNKARRAQTQKRSMGQLVWARNWTRPKGVAGKLEPEFSAPYVVVQVFHTNMITVRHLGTSERQIFLQIGHTTPMYDTDGELLFLPINQVHRGKDEDVDDEIDSPDVNTHYKVEHVVNHGWSTSGRLTFEVVWEGFPNQNTWQDEHHLECQMAVRRYFATRVRIHRERTPML
jgi:hypothetical protein